MASLSFLFPAGRHTCPQDLQPELFRLSRPEGRGDNAAIARSFVMWIGGAVL